MSVINNLSLNVYNRFHFPFNKEEKAKPFNPKATLNKCEQIWNYLGKANLLVRHTLNGSTKVCLKFIFDNCQINDKVKNVVTHLKIFSVLGIPLNVLSIKSIAVKIFQSFKINDKEGFALHNLSLTLILADTLDSIITVINSISTLVTNESIAALSSIGTPLAFGMIGLGSVLRVVQAAKTHAVFKKFKNEIFKNREDPLKTETALRKFIEQNIGVTAEEMKLLQNNPKNRTIDKSQVEELRQKELLTFTEKKNVLFQRNTAPEIVKEFNKIEGILKDSQSITVEQSKEILQSIERIHFFFKKKMTITVGNLASNALSAAGLSLFFVPAPPVLPFLFLGLSIILRLSFVAYQDFAKPQVAKA